MYEEELLDEIKKYIELHLYEEISLERLSDAICYSQGVEVPAAYSGKIPDKMLMLELPACQYLIFQSNPFQDDDEIMARIITQMQQSIKNYNPQLYGFEWAENGGPRFQLEPIPARGYIEGYPVKVIS